MWLVFIVLLVLLGCDNGLEPVDHNNKIVVQGYLVMGEKIEGVQLTYPMEFLSDDSICDPVVNAEVSVSYDGIAVPLTSARNNGYYSADIVVEASKIYTFTARIAGYKQATARAVIPNKPQSALDQATISINAREVSLQQAREAIRSGAPHPKMTLRIADHTPSDWYYVILRSKQRNPRQIWGRQSGRRRQWAMRTDIFNTSEFEINFEYLRFQGEHQAIVYRIAPEYAAYYNTIKKSNDLGITTFLEPKGNITNGMGIFTGFACDTVDFTVTTQ